MPGTRKLWPQKPPEEGFVSGQGKWRQSLGVLMGLSAVGIEMGAAVGIGIGAGYYLDRRFGTGHWLLLFFSVCGLSAAGQALARLIRRLRKPLAGNGDGGSAG